MAKTSQIQQGNIEDNEHRICILIDGDNAQASLIEQILVEAGKFGNATIRRIYGDWTTPNMNSWKDILNIHAFQPIQQFRYSIGKNATDSAMIIAVWSQATAITPAWLRESARAVCWWSGLVRRTPLVHS